jgi:two-component system, NarL family, response regulator DevR
MVRVMLVDDHEVVRKGLRAMLDDLDDIQVVAEATSANEAVQRGAGSQPDVVVMDMRLPDRSGVLACRDIRAEQPEVTVLMLTSLSGDQALFDSIMAGAAGYVFKQIRGNDLVEASTASPPASRCSTLRSPPVSSTGFATLRVTSTRGWLA